MHVKWAHWLVTTATALFLLVLGGCATNPTSNDATAEVAASLADSAAVTRWVDPTATASEGSLYAVLAPPPEAGSDPDRATATRTLHEQLRDSAWVRDDPNAVRWFALHLPGSDAPETLWGYRVPANMTITYPGEEIMLDVVDPRNRQIVWRGMVNHGNDVIAATQQLLAAFLADEAR